MKRFIVKIFILLSISFMGFNFSQASEQFDINDSIINDKFEVPQISTNEMKKAIKNGALIIDNRPYFEWAVSHIPNAVTVSPKPGISRALYTSDKEEIKKLANNDKSKLIILYCDGIYCGKTRRVSKELVQEGFKNVYRYQLGIPVWRALGNLTQCEIEGVRYIYEKDGTAYFIDSRKENEFKTKNLKISKNIPHDKVLEGKDVGEIFKAKEDGRLPVDDRNTRIVVFGKNLQETLKVADAIAKEAFHNVCFFAGKVEEILNLEALNSSK